jgi:GT2 family glycosyltransferase
MIATGARDTNTTPNRKLSGTSPAPTGSDAPEVSVIVPTFNRCDRLERLLQHLDRAHGTAPAFDVTVVVDGSTDGTRSMLASLPTRYSLRILHQQNSGPAAARNAAIGTAQGEVLLFLDDDVVPVDGLIARHAEVHRRNRHAVVIGPMLPPPGMSMAPWLRWEAATLQKQYEAMMAGLYAPTPRQFFTANASVRREHAVAAGGFDESFTRAEDVEFAWRLADQGLQFCFVPDAKVWHEPHRTFSSWLHVAREYGRHDVRLWAERGREYILPVLQNEYAGRHALSRLVTRLCLGHPRRFVMAQHVLAAAGYLSGRFRAARLSAFAYSGLFTLAYSQGFADALGGTRHFWAAVHGSTAVQAPTGAGTLQPVPRGT